MFTRGRFVPARRCSSFARADFGISDAIVELTTKLPRVSAPQIKLERERFELSMTDVLPAAFAKVFLLIEISTES
jgi:hypothetical protein